MNTTNYSLRNGLDAAQVQMIQDRRREEQLIGNLRTDSHVLQQLGRLLTNFGKRLGGDHEMEVGQATA